MHEGEGRGGGKREGGKREEQPPTMRRERMTREPGSSFLVPDGRLSWAPAGTEAQETRSGLACRGSMYDSRIRFGCLVGVLLAGTGCDVIKIDHGKTKMRAEQLAEAWCAAYESCDCSPFPTDSFYPDPSECVAQETQRILASFEQAEDNGLSFDQGCMDQLIASYDTDLGCQSTSAVFATIGNPAAPENLGCALYHGDEVDGICEDVAGTPWSDCAAGLRCGANSCTPQLSLAGAGEPCADSYGPQSHACEPGLYCDQVAGCTQPQQLGDPCEAGIGPGVLICAPDLYCDLLDDTCAALQAGGEVCRADDFSCHGTCERPADDPNAEYGVCLDVPAICLSQNVQPPVQPL